MPTKISADWWSDATSLNPMQLVVWERSCMPCECRAVRLPFLHIAGLLPDTPLRPRIECDMAEKSLASR
jgi:hypothetical protein